MKRMTCRQLGGACDLEFKAETFEEMSELSKNHGNEMHDDPEHQVAMQKMMDLMKNPEDMKQWMKERREKFDSLPEE